MIYDITNTKTKSNVLGADPYGGILTLYETYYFFPPMSWLFSFSFMLRGTPVNDPDRLSGASSVAW